MPVYFIESFAITVPYGVCREALPPDACDRHRLYLVYSDQ